MQYGCKNQDEINNLNNFIIRAIQTNNIYDQLRLILQEMVKKNHYYISQTTRYTKQPFKKFWHTTFFNSGENETSHKLLEQVLHVVNFVEEIEYSLEHSLDTNEKLARIKSYIDNDIFPALESIRRSSTKPIVLTPSTHLNVHYRGRYPSATEANLHRICDCITQYTDGPQEVYTEAQNII